MRSSRRLLLAIVAMVLAGIAAAPVSHGHGDEQALVLEPSTSWPGGTITIRGDVPTTSTLVLVLRSATGTRATLTTVEDPARGHFETVAAVPASAAPGIWSVVALAGVHEVGSAELAIAPAPPTGEQDDRAEPVAAGPELRPTALPSRASTPASTQGTSAMGTPGGPAPWLAGVAALGMAGTLLALRRRASRPRASG